MGAESYRAFLEEKVPDLKPKDVNRLLREEFIENLLNWPQALLFIFGWPFLIAFFVWDIYRMEKNIREQD